MKKFINIKTKGFRYDYIFNMDNVCHISYLRGNGEIKFTFNFPVSYLETLEPATEKMVCSEDEYKAIVNFLKSKDETYLEL